MNRHATAVRRRRRKIGEVAGGTAAACAAVWCCCPCAAVSLLVLALCKVPAGLCRRAWAHRRNGKSLTSKKKKKMGGGELLLERRPSGPAYGPIMEELVGKMDGLGVAVCADDVAESELDEEMWGRFSKTGFWRSPSRRDE